MTSQRELGVRLRRFYVDTAHEHVDDAVVDAVLDRTRGARQRAGWAVAVRGGAFGIGRRLWLGPIPPRMVATAVLAALLIALVAALLIASGPPRPASPMLFHTWDDESQGQLFSVRVDGGPPVPILRGFAGRLHVSPDGRLVLFQVGGDGEIILARTDGANQQVLAATGLLGREWEKVWAPDSHAVVFIEEPTLVIATPGTGQSQRLSLPPGAKFEIYWSPDNVHLLLHMTASGEDSDAQALYLVDTAAETTVEVGRGLRLIGPAWSPDGHTIAAVVQEGARSTLSTIDAESQTITPLGQGLNVGGLAWSAGGSALMWFEDIGDGRVRAWSQGRNAATAQLIAVLPAAYAIWSPDRSRLAWVRFDATGLTSNESSSLWVLELSNPQPRLLATNVGSSGAVLWPKWSPDGQWLAFQRGPFDPTVGGRGGSVWIVHESGEGERLLIDSSVDLDGGTVDW